MVNAVNYSFPDIQIPNNVTRSEFIKDVISEIMNRKEDAEKKVKELESLLIQYILANMKGDENGKKGIEDQLNTVMKEIVNDLKVKNDLTNLLTQFESDRNPDIASFVQQYNEIIKRDSSS